jgi:hypothetical protein
LDGAYICQPTSGTVRGTREADFEDRLESSPHDAFGELLLELSIIIIKVSERSIRFELPIKSPKRAETVVFCGQSFFSAES